MTEDEIRAAVVAEAMTWLGTPWAHQARVKGVGVDCAQFPLLVYANAGVFQPFDPGDYPSDWHIHRDEERYLGIVLSLGCREIAEEDVKPGDLILVKIGRVYSHGAIVTKWPQAIHASLPDRRVTLCDVDRDARMNYPRRYFTYWEAADGG